VIKNRENTQKSNLKRDIRFLPNPQWRTINTYWRSQTKKIEPI